MAMIGFIDNFVWMIAAEISVWQFHLVRAAMALPLLVLAAAVFGLPLWPKRSARIAIRAAVQSFAMLCHFAALGLLPIAQVGAALFTAPLFRTDLRRAPLRPAHRPASSLLSRWASPASCSCSVPTRPPWASKP